MAVRELVDWELVKADDLGITVVGQTPAGISVFTSFVKSYSVDPNVLRVTTFTEGYVLRAETAKNILHVGGDFNRLIEDLLKSKIKPL